MKVWENIVSCAVLATAISATADSGSVTHSPWQSASKMTHLGADPECILNPPDLCPQRWQWPATSVVISCAPGATGYRAPSWPGGNTYFCCDGKAEWRYEYLNLQTAGIQYACDGVILPL
jgi:hypothetical protein